MGRASEPAGRALDPVGRASEQVRRASEEAVAPGGARVDFGVHLKVLNLQNDLVMHLQLLKNREPRSKKPLIYDVYSHISVVK